MTGSQIESYGIPVNQWTTLENAFGAIGLMGDNNLYINPTSIQFYFETDSDSLFLRRTVGSAYPLAKNASVRPGYALIVHDGKEYEVRVAGNAFKDATVGYYHDLVSFDSVVGFYRAIPDNRRFYEE